MNSLFLNIVTYASGISVILGCFTMIFFKLIKPTALWFNKVSQSADIVKQELCFNGGSSIKDAIQKIGLQLSAIEGKKRALLTHMKIAFFETDINGELTFASIICCHLFHRSAEELIGHGWLNFISDVDRARVEEQWDKVIRESSDLMLTFNIKVPDSNNTIPVCFESYVIRDKFYKKISMLALITPYAGCPDKSNETDAA